MDRAKLLDVLTSLPVSQSILPRAVCFATSRPANHAICSFIDSSGYAFGPIRRCLFIDYIITCVSTFRFDHRYTSSSHRGNIPPDGKLGKQVPLFITRSSVLYVTQIISDPAPKHRFQQHRCHDNVHLNNTGVTVAFTLPSVRRIV